MLTSNTNHTGPDLNEWLPDSEAAARLQISEKTLLRWAQDNKLQRVERPRKGKKPEMVCHPGDIERLERERMPAFLTHADAPGQMSELSTTTTPSNHSTALARANGAGLQQLVGMLAQAIEAARPLPDPGPWMTIKQASDHSGLTKAMLRRAIAAGALPSIRDRALKVRRRDVDNLDVGRIVSESRGKAAAGGEA